MHEAMVNSGVAVVAFVISSVVELSTKVKGVAVVVLVRLSMMEFCKG